MRKQASVKKLRKFVAICRLIGYTIIKVRVKTEKVV